GHRLLLADGLRSRRAGRRLPPLAHRAPARRRTQPAGRLAPRRPERRRQPGLDGTVPACRTGASLPVHAARTRSHGQGAGGRAARRPLPALAVMSTLDEKAIALVSEVKTALTRAAPQLAANGLKIESVRLDLEASLELTAGGKVSLFKILTLEAKHTRAETQ